MLKKQKHPDNDDIHFEDVPQKSKKEDKIDSFQDDVYNNDIEIEDEGSQSDIVKKLRKKLNSCQKERGEYLTGWQRSKADFINAKRSFEEEKKEYISFAKENVLEELLPVVDSFDMAFANKDAWESVDKNWRTGVEYIHSQFVTILENNGLKQIDPLGKVFDPREHTSVEMVETDRKKEADHIAEVVQKGYRLNDKIVRSPKVKVFSYKKKDVFK